MPVFAVPRPASTPGASCRPRAALTPLIAGAAALTVLLAGCGGAGDAGADEDRLLVLTSTDVYASLAEHVVDGQADVEAVVDDPAADPHSYEASPQDRLRVEQADVLVANGGGYDAFLTQLASSAEKDDAVIQVLEGPNEHVDESSESGSGEHSLSGSGGAHAGHDHGSAAPEGNEHVWYDLPMMSDFVVELADRLGKEDPAHAEEFAARAEELVGEIDALDARARALDADGLTALSTEPVSAHLLTRVGFEDVTDTDFLSAVEHGDDVSPRLYRQALDTASGEDLDLLAYNAQTETRQSRRIRAAAEDAGTAVLDFRETLPDGTDDYLEWMGQNVDAMAQVVEDAEQSREAEDA